MDATRQGSLLARARGAQRGRLSWMARLLVAIGLVILILRSINLGEFTQVVVAPRWAPLVGMVGAALVFMLLGTVKVWIILSALAPLRLLTLVRYNLVATSVGTFTPGGLGDFSLVGFLRREGIPIHQGLSTMLVDRSITFALQSFVFLPLTLLFVLGRSQWLWLPAACGVAAVVALAFNLVAPVRRWLRHQVRRFAPQLEDFLRTGSELLRIYPARLGANVALTLLRSAVAGVVIYLTFVAAGVRADFLRVAVIANCLSLLNYIPISLSGVGVYEGGAVAVFSYLGLPSERVFAAFVFQRAYIIAFSLLLLLLARLILPARDELASPQVGVGS